MMKERRSHITTGPWKNILLSFVIPLALTCCISSELKISEFEFIYNNTKYKIRSAYCPGNPESCNQLSSENFIATDLDQDRIIDEIISGDVSLSEAQEVYDHCLNLLESQNKLSQISKEDKKYIFTDFEFNFEIQTLYPKTKMPLNEFTIADKRKGKVIYKVSVFMDNDADGILDELLKGDIELKEAQLMYKNVLEKGLATNNLEQINNNIVVR
ncbi:MAG: hypothetical protein OQJ81_12990 [Melioribacteraceae bacterium]|nr:hypothetical protein [Melioribacteraceae bacterium]